MDILEKISSLKWGITKEEYKSVFSDKHFVDYHPEEKNVVVFLKIDNGIEMVVSAFFINENIYKLASIIVTFCDTRHQRLDDDASNKLFKKNKNELISIYGEPNYIVSDFPPEFIFTKHLNWKTDNSIVVLSLQLSKEYQTLYLSKNIVSETSTFNIPPSVAINIADINNEKKIGEYIINQSIKMKQSQDKELEKELKKFYVPMFQKTMNISLSQAQNMFSDMLNRAKEISKEGDTTNLPTNYGDIILKEELTNKKIKLGLNRKRAEGVTNEDIKRWWNSCDIERSMAFAMDEITKIATVDGLIEKNGLSREEAWKRIPKYCPIFGDPYDSSDTDNRYNPLPLELKNRVNVYIEKRVKVDYEQFKKEIEESPSFNSLIRNEIKKNNL